MLPALLLLAWPFASAAGAFLLCGIIRNADAGENAARGMSDRDEVSVHGGGNI